MSFTKGIETIVSSKDFRNASHEEATMRENGLSLSVASTEGRCITCDRERSDAVYSDGHGTYVTVQIRGCDH